MIQTYLINILLFCGILLLLSLTVAVIQGILIFIDIRKMTHEVKEKVLAVTSVLDILTAFLGGLGIMKSKLSSESTIIGFAAGLKKALQILFKK
ncbi:MAG: hypothetical protein ABIH50_06315 [bacterium]